MVVVLYLDNSTTKGYLCNQGVSFQTSCVLNLANKHILTVIPAYIPTHLKVEVKYLFRDTGLRMISSSFHNFSEISSLMSTGGWFAGILMYQSMPLLYLGEAIAFRKCFGVEHFKSSLEVSGMLWISSCTSSSGSVQVSGKRCHRSIQMSNSHWTLLDRSSLSSHCSQHDGRCSSSVSHCRRSCLEWFSRPGANGSAITAFNPMVAERHELCR